MLIWLKMAQCNLLILKTVFAQKANVKCTFKKSSYLMNDTSDVFKVWVTIVFYSLFIYLFIYLSHVHTHTPTHTHTHRVHHTHTHTQQVIKKYRTSSLTWSYTHAWLERVILSTNVNNNTQTHTGSTQQRETHSYKTKR